MTCNTFLREARRCFFASTLLSYSPKTLNGKVSCPSKQIEHIPQGIWSLEQRNTLAHGQMVIQPLETWASWAFIGMQVL